MRNILKVIKEEVLKLWHSFWYDTRFMDAILNFVIGLGIIVSVGACFWLLFTFLPALLVVVAAMVLVFLILCLGAIVRGNNDGRKKKK